MEAQNNVIYNNLRKKKINIYIFWAYWIMIYEYVFVLLYVCFFSHVNNYSYTSNLIPIIKLYESFWHFGSNQFIRTGTNPRVIIKDRALYKGSTKFDRKNMYYYKISVQYKETKFQPTIKKSKYIEMDII